MNDTPRLDRKAKMSTVMVGDVEVKWIRNENQWQPRQANKSTRIYVWASEFNVIEDLQNRTRRPHDAWRPRVLDVLKTLGFTDVRMYWSQKAGCSCGCSPGFVVRPVNDGIRLFGGDLHIHLTDAPSVDETKPARTLI